MLLPSFRTSASQTRAIRNPAFVIESPSAIPKGFRAASAPRAGYFFLFGQEKVTKKKAARRRLKNSCASRPGRALAELAGG
jgi:hypothetical protein